MERGSRAKTKKSHLPNITPKQSFTPNRASFDYPKPASSTKMLPNSPSHPMASGTQFTNSTRKLVTSSVSKLCIHSDDLQKANITTATTADITIEVSSKSSLELQDFVVVSDLKLPPILIGKERYTKSLAKRSHVGLHRLQMRVSSSPRITVKKVLVQNGRRSSGLPTRSRKRLSESFAVVKSSLDPEKDFRESMVEMIVEKDIRAAKDLEELLAWYLTLNTNEYHDVIVKVFQQIWFDLSDFIRL